MERHGDEAHVTTTEARGGSTPGVVRYVLIIGMLLAIGALSVIWITGAMNADQPAKNSVISGQATPAS